MSVCRSTVDRLVAHILRKWVLNGALAVFSVLVASILLLEPEKRHHLTSNVIYNVVPNTKGLPDFWIAGLQEKMTREKSNWSRGIECDFG
jgi:hypothetical protein